MNNSVQRHQLTDLTVTFDYSNDRNPPVIIDTYDAVTSLYEDLVSNGSIEIICPGEDIVITLAGIDEIVTEENYNEIMRMMKLMDSDIHGAKNLLDALRQVHAIPMIEDAVDKLQLAA